MAAFAAPFRIDNALNHPLFRERARSGATAVRSYLGVPLRTRDGHALGSFCVADTRPRQWSPEEQQVLEELAEKAMALAEPDEVSPE